MVARFVWGAVVAATLATPALADSMTADEARKFVSGKVFAFTCFDGTRGAGRVFDDGGAAGAVQFSGSGPSRNMRLPGNTLQVRGQAICASIKGLPFEPCFNLVKNDERSFRGAVSGMGFAYCDFRHQGGRGQMLMARSLSSPRSLRAPSTRSAEATAGETVTRVSTPRVEIGKIEAVGSIKSEPAKSEIPKVESAKAEATKAETKTETKAEAPKSEPEKTEALELRKSTN